MSTASFSRPVTITPDWVVDNLLKGMDKRAPILDRIKTPEFQAEFKRRTEHTPEELKALMEKVCANYS